MKVVHLVKKETVVVRDIPARREAEAQELLLEPILVGLAGLDAMRFRKGPTIEDGFLKPHIPASEFVARVVGTGRGVDTGFMGRRVVANPVSPCLRCESCVEGKHHLCQNGRMLGRPPVPGAMQQRFAWPASLCTIVPDEVPDEVAVLVTPIGMALHILDLAAPPIMSRVAVIGCGHMGLLLIRMLRTAGVGDILAVDPVEYRRQAAIEWGATEAEEPLEAEELMRRWKRSGVDIAIDISNASEGAREAASLTRYGGKVFLAGTPTENRVILNAIEARDKELSIQFVRRPHDTFERAVELLRNGNLGDVSRIITHRLPMDNVAEAYRIIRKYDEEALKVVIEMPGYESKAE